MHRHAQTAEHAGRRALAHADRAGKPQDQHQPLPKTWARNSAVTLGLWPNQDSNPGTA
jgi:hypothetical protein